MRRIVLSVGIVLGAMIMPARAGAGEDLPLADLGSLEAPLPLGRVADLGNGWSVAVVDVVDDPAPLMVERFSRRVVKPPEGKQFLLLQLFVHRAGGSDAVFNPRVQLQVISPATGDAYRAADEYCELTPSEIPVRALPAGGTLQGNICVLLPATEGALRALVAYVEPQGLAGRHAWLGLGRTP